MLSVGMEIIHTAEQRVARADAERCALAKYGTAQALEAKRRMLDKKRRLIGLSKFGTIRSRAKLADFVDYREPPKDEEVEYNL